MYIQEMGSTPGTAKGGRSHRTDGFAAACRHHWMTGEKGGERLSRTDRTHARSAATVGNSESLVQVEVANIRTDVRELAQPDLGVHVGTIEVDESAVGVDDLTDLFDMLFKDPMGGRVGDHDGGQLLAVGLGLGDLRSWRSKSPRSSVLIGTTFIPAITELAGLVPWADVGTRQTLR